MSARPFQWIIDLFFYLFFASINKIFLQEISKSCKCCRIATTISLGFSIQFQDFWHLMIFLKLVPIELDKHLQSQKRLFLSLCIWLFIDLLSFHENSISRLEARDANRHLKCPRDRNEEPNSPARDTILLQIKNNDQKHRNSHHSNTCKRNDHI